MGRGLRILLAWVLAGALVGGASVPRPVLAAARKACCAPTRTDVTSLGRACCCTVTEARAASAPVRTASLPDVAADAPHVAIVAPLSPTPLSITAFVSSLLVTRDRVLWHRTLLL